MDALYICELPKNEKLKYYKQIKKSLIEKGFFNLENLENAMNSKIIDLSDLIY